MSCGTAIDYQPFAVVTCSVCGADWLEPRYDYAAFKREVLRGLPGRPANLWRYHDILPVENPLALDLNSAEALDLESVLQLLRKEAAAFLQFRSKRGPFTSMSDLKDLNPVILKKIEAKKDRVVFRSR